MKKALFYTGIAALLAGCSSEPKDQFIITGEAKGFNDGTIVYLRAEDSEDLNKIDSTYIKNNTFTFKGKQAIPNFGLIEIDTTKENFIPLIIEKGNIKITYNSEDISYKIEGTENNNIAYKFIEYKNESENEIEKILADNEEIIKKARETKDTATLKGFREKFNAITDNQNKYSLDFINENSTALYSLVVLEDGIDIATFNDEEAQNLYAGLSTEVKSSIRGKKLNDRLEKLKLVSIGATAPDFSAPNANGETASLYENLGKITILDFWAAWCGPCRQANPNLVALNNEFKDKGLAIIGVSLDRSEQAWKKAIKDDKLEWLQLSNLKYFNDPIAKTYQVRAIPALFILDENGKILAKDLHGKELKNKIAELLK